MEGNQIVGLLLIATALLVISGFTVANETYWEVVDAVVIAVCMSAGAFLLRKKGK